MARLGTLVTGAGLALALSLTAACGSSSSKDDSTLPSYDGSSSSSPSASPTGLALPGYLHEPDAPAHQAKTLASAKEFTAYALQLVQYSYAARDVAPLKAHVTDWQKCSACLDDEKGTDKQLRGGYAQIPSAMPKAGPISVMDRASGRYSLVTTFAMPKGKKVADDGTVLDSIPGIEGTFEAHLRWAPAKKTWQIENYRMLYGTA